MCPRLLLKYDQFRNRAVLRLLAQLLLSGVVYKKRNNCMLQLGLVLISENKIVSKLEKESSCPIIEALLLKWWPIEPRISVLYIKFAVRRRTTE